MELILKHWPAFLWLSIGKVVAVALVTALGGFKLETALFTFLQIGTSNHNEHHMYPAIPCWRLPRVHKLLEAQDFYKANGIPNESGFFSGFRFARSRYVYSKGLDI